LGGKLIVVSGTGTGIGKTHFSEALLGALGRSGARVSGVKPIETGLSQAGPSDAHRLDRVSSFHVKRSWYAYSDPVSPHIAARETRRPILIDTLADDLAAIRSELDILLIELPGGLFSPLSEASVNAHLARSLRPDALLLVASDRLGVLHEVLSTILAASTIPIAVSGVVLMAPERPDSSTGRNASELAHLAAIGSLTTLPRAPPEELAVLPMTVALAARLLRDT
jgi:dethiobiotin synthetase